MEVLSYSPETVAQHIYDVLKAAIAEHGSASLGIPGGRSPGPVLTALAGLFNADDISQLHLLWLDERAVPVGHDDRNDRGTLAAWQAGGPLPGHVHNMPAELDDLNAAAQAYAETFASATAGRGLDVAFIGIGEDGHFASCFPNHALLDNTETVFAIYDSPKPPPQRLSLSVPVIAAARCKIVVVLGSVKGAQVAQGFAAPGPAIPISLLPHDEVSWYGDKAAQSEFAK